VPPKIDNQPSPKPQRNFTDPESSIMNGSDGGFIRAYNCQAGVDGSPQVIVASEVSAIASDGAQVEPMIMEMLENLGALP
jgi:hypothetical protein